MSFWSKITNIFKKKNGGLGEDDGQAEFFKEDFDGPKKSENKKTSTDTGNKKPVKREEEKTEKAKSVESEAKSEKSKPTKTEAKPEETKKPERAKKPASANNDKTATPRKTEIKPEENAKKEEKKQRRTESAHSTSELRDDSPEVVGASTVEESKPTTSGKFDIRKAKDGRYFFSLYASNHTVIAYSQIYSSVSAVNTGIKSVISNATKAEIEDTTLKKVVTLPCPKWEIYTDKAGEYRFRLYATNGQCVCHSSHGYSTKSGCKGGIDSIRRFASEARVDKSYLN